MFGHDDFWRIRKWQISVGVIIIIIIILIIIIIIIIER
jgi:hypothetical protein